MRRQKTRRPHRAAPEAMARESAAATGWGFELTPERLCWREDARDRRTGGSTWGASRLVGLLALFIFVVAGVTSLLGTTGMAFQGKSFDDWGHALRVGVEMPLLLTAGVVLGTVLLIVAGGAVVLMVFRQGSVFELEPSRDRWRCSHARLGFGRTTDKGTLADLLLVEVTHYSPTWERNYSVEITFRTGVSGTRTVHFHCDMTKEVMLQHRQWLVEKLGEKRVPPPRACQPD